MKRYGLRSLFCLCVDYAARLNESFRTTIVGCASPFGLLRGVVQERARRRLLRTTLRLLRVMAAEATIGERRRPVAG